MIAEAVSKSSRRRYVLLAVGAAVVFILATFGPRLFRYLTRPRELVLERDTVWSSGVQALTITNRVVVPAGVTLTIQPGTTVCFRPRAGLWIRGRLLAEGTEPRRIRLARLPQPMYLWAGITFEDSQQDNRLRYTDIESAGSEGQYLHVLRSNVTVEHARFFGAQCNVIESADSSLILRRSIVDPIGANEVLHVRRAPVGGHILVEGNVFYPNYGYKDIVDVADCRSPGAVPQFINNIFLGSGDDGLDIDRSEAYIEGNVFVHFNLRGHKKFADAISADNHSRLVVTNNLFAYNDHAIVLIDGSEVQLINNIFYRNRYAAVSLNERDKGPGGARIENCIFWENNASFLHDKEATELIVTNSDLPEAGRWPDQGNINADPKFVDVVNGDFRLQPDSPAVGRGATIDPSRFPRLPAHEPGD